MNSENTKARRSGKPFIIKMLIYFFICLIVIVIAITIAFKFSPWPSALLIRYAFNKEGVKVNQALGKYVPKDVSAVLNLQYDSEDRDAFMDVYTPSGMEQNNKQLPAIIWVHGGGWISGSKAQVANYCKILSGKGYVVVAIDYSIAPEKKYPTPLRQTNEALAYLVKNAGRLHIDISKFLLAGDSGGAHISAQVANLIVVPAYAALLKIKPAIQASQLSGVMLYCGPYDARNIDLNGDFGSFLKTVLWSYSGKKDFLTDAEFATASIINYVNEDFPSTFISVGNGDPLSIHSYKLASRLNSLGVHVDSLFFPSNYSPSLLHEYQFNLSTDAGRLALDRSVKFLSTVHK